MKLCVLSPPDGWHFLDLKRAASADDEIHSLSFEELSAQIGVPVSAHPLSQFDCILARAMPAGSLQQVVFRMDVLLELERRGATIVNPPRTIECAVDKYLSLSRLQAAGIPVPPTAVSQTVETALLQFESLGRDVVVKPLFGSMGQGLARISHREEAETVFAELAALGNVIYQQTYIDHGGTDLRLLVVGPQVLAMRRINSGHWITNIAQGGKGQPHAATATEIGLAQQAARSVGARIAGVDLCYDPAGQPFVIEINSAPSWRTISSVLEIDVAKIVLGVLKVPLTD